MSELHELFELLRIGRTAVDAGWEEIEDFEEDPDGDPFGESPEDIYADLRGEYDDAMRTIRAHLEAHPYALLEAWTKLLDSEMVLLHLESSPAESANPAAIRAAMALLGSAWRELSIALAGLSPVPVPHDLRAFILLDRIERTTERVATMAWNQPERQVFETLNDAVLHDPLLRGCLHQTHSRMLRDMHAEYPERFDGLRVFQEITRLELLASDAFNSAFRAADRTPPAVLAYAGIAYAGMIAPHAADSARSVFAQATKVLTKLPDIDSGLWVKHLETESIVRAAQDGPTVQSIMDELDHDDTPLELIAHTLAAEGTTLEAAGMFQNALRFLDAAHAIASTVEDPMFRIFVGEHLANVYALRTRSEHAREIVFPGSHHRSVPELSVTYGLERARVIALESAIVAEAAGALGESLALTERAISFSHELSRISMVRATDDVSFERTADACAEPNGPFAAMIAMAHVADLHSHFGNDRLASRSRRAALQAFAQDRFGRNLVAAFRDRILSAGPQPISEFSQRIQDCGEDLARRTEAQQHTLAYALLTAAELAALGELADVQLSSPGPALVTADLDPNAPPGEVRRPRPAGMKNVDGNEPVAVPRPPADIPSLNRLMGEALLARGEVLHGIGLHQEGLESFYDAEHAFRVAGDDIGELTSGVLIQMELDRAREAEPRTTRDESGPDLN